MINYLTFSNDNIHSYNMSSASKIHIDFKRTNDGKFSLKYRGATIWNSLPNDLKISIHILHLKKHCCYISRNNHINQVLEMVKLRHCFTLINMKYDTVVIIQL